MRRPKDHSCVIRRAHHFNVSTSILQITDYSTIHSVACLLRILAAIRCNFPVRFTCVLNTSEEHVIGIITSVLSLTIVTVVDSTASGDCTLQTLRC
jgi:hypothetical protein